MPEGTSPRDVLVQRVDEEIGTLQRELAEPGAREAFEKAAAQLDLPADLALAALYRAARRSGLTLGLFAEQVGRGPG